MRALEQDDGSEVQTLILSRDRFDTVDDARAWIADQDTPFRADKVDETETSFRFRQFAPGQCESEPRTIDLTDGVSAVICVREAAQESSGCGCGAREQDEGGAQVQELMFDQDRFDERSIVDWIQERIENGRPYRAGDIRPPSRRGKYFRVEQFPQDECTNRPSTITLTDGVKAVICARGGGDDGAQESSDDAPDSTVLERPAQVASETPGQYLNRLEVLGGRALARSLDRLHAHQARQDLRGIPTVGRGWTRRRVAEAIRATEAHLELHRAAEAGMGEERPFDEVVPEREGGIHAHALMPDGSTDIGGRHAHLFLHQGRLLFTEFDGAHRHGPGDDDSGRTDPEDEHKHAAIVQLQDGSTETIIFETATEHTHEKLTETTALDGLHQHTATLEDGTEIVTISPEEFRQLFQVIEEIVVSPDLADRYGCTRVETGHQSLKQFWAQERGTEALRQALAPWVLGEAVREDETQEHEAAPKWFSVEGFAISLGTRPISIREADEDRFIIIDASDGPTTVLKELTTTRDLARMSAAAAVTEDRDLLILAEFAGTAAEGPAMGREIYRAVAEYSLAREEAVENQRATEAVLATLDRLTIQHAGHFIRATEADDDGFEWDVVVISAGLSRNRNFWSADLLREKMIRVLEGAPLEAIQAQPRGHRGTKMTHLPLPVVAELKGHSVTLNGVGQLRDLRWDPSAEGIMPDDDEIRVLAKVLGVTENDVRQQAKGAIVGKAMLDQTERGKAMRDMLVSAESRESLDDYLGLSIDVERAPAVALNVPDGKPILLRTGVDGTGRAVVDFVSHPSAGGKIIGKAA